MSSIIKLENIVKKFYIGEPNELEILRGISLEVEDGEFISIVGPSGSGKSTLMNMIGVLDRPTSGKYVLDGIDVDDADDSELSEIRNSKIGFVFQTYNLIPKTNAIKNIELPMLYGGMPRKERIERARYLLDLVEMSDRAKHLPEELSGGQKQRVAIARAMANNPAIVLADEPTGALDSKTGRLVMDLFHKLNKQEKKTVILITHSSELASETDRIVSIRDGVITGIKDNREFRFQNIEKNRALQEKVNKENEEHLLQEGYIIADEKKDDKTGTDTDGKEVDVVKEVEVTKEDVINNLKEVKDNAINELMQSVDEKIGYLEKVLSADSGSSEGALPNDAEGKLSPEEMQRIEKRVEDIKNNIQDLNDRMEKFKSEGGQKK